MKWECNCCESDAGDMNGCVLMIKDTLTALEPDRCPWDEDEPSWKLIED